MGNGTAWTLLLGGSVISLLLDVPGIVVLVGAIIWFFIFAISEQSEAHDERMRQMREELEKERDKNKET